MGIKNECTAVRLDALGLFLAGLINTFLALFVAGIILGPGTVARQPDLLLRAGWIADHTLRWQSGWLFWFAVTLSFSWSYFALGRHLEAPQPWIALAIGLALIAAAVDIVGVLVNMTVIPPLAAAMPSSPGDTAPALQVLFDSMERLTNALTNVAAFGLYSFAGLILLPAVFSTPGYPRWLAWLGVAEWGIAAIATALLVVSPGLATGPLLISFALYAPWVWGSALWLLRGKPTV
jgi:hypothetical protein